MFLIFVDEGYFIHPGTGTTYVYTCDRKREKFVSVQSGGVSSQLPGRGGRLIRRVYRIGILVSLVNL